MIRPGNPVANAVADHLDGIARKAHAERVAANQPIDSRQLLLAASGRSTMTFMEPPEVFDDHLVGTAEVGDEFVAAYNKLAVVNAISAQQDVTHEEAFDLFTAALREMHTRYLEATLSDSPLPRVPLFLVDLRDLG